MLRSVVTLLCSALLLLPTFQEPEIRVEVEAVNVLVAVTNKQGRFVTDLSQDRFRIFEDGKEQEITNFIYGTDLPLDIALLVDTSASVRIDLDFEKETVTGFVYSVMRPKDRAMLVEFDTGVSLVHDFTDSPSDIARSIRDLRAGGGTSLLDALYTVSLEKMTRPGTRKAVVIVSDGRDLHSKHGIDEALGMAHRAGVIVYAIGTTRFGADQDKKGEKMLKKLAENTGGRAFFPYVAERLADSFDLINEELRSQYSVTYVPLNKKKDGKFRKIKLKIKDDKGLTARYRQGYYAPVEQTGE